ncbi:unnamed protein product [Parajaminaea phylloscopi]
MASVARAAAAGARLSRGQKLVRPTRLAVRNASTASRVHESSRPPIRSTSEGLKENLSDAVTAAVERTLLRPKVDHTTVSDSVAGTDKVHLRPYQETAVAECLETIAQGITRIGVSSPTGSGKTTMFTELIARLPPVPHPAGDRPPGTRVLIIVSSAELASQAAAAVTRAYPDYLVEIDQGAKYHASGLADVTVATWQSLIRGDEKRLAKYHPQDYKGVIVDEAHHAASPSYITLLSHFDTDVGLSREQRQRRDEAQDVQGVDGHRQQSALPSSSAAAAAASSAGHRVPIIGFSATFVRHDGLALGRIFDRIVFHRDFLSMIDEKWLCPVRFTSIKSDLDLSAVSISKATGDFAPRSLSRLANVPAINRLIVRSWLDRAANRRSTLVFCADVAHTIDLTAEFRQAGVDARYLHGGITAKERKSLLDGFKRGEYKVLVNCAILTEGFDLPQIDVVILARPTRSRNLFSQMIGRGLRLSPSTGKYDCLVLDLVGSIDRGVVCTPTLFGLDPEDDIEDVTLDELREWSERRKDEGEAPEDIDPEKVTFVDYESPHELQQALIQRGEGNVAKYSPNAWVHCGGETYVLEIPRKGFIRVQRASEREDEGGPSHGGQSEASSEAWIATFTPVNPGIDEALAIAGSSRAQSQPDRSGSSPFRRPIPIFGDEPAPHLEACLRACDTYALKRVLFAKKPEHPLLRRDAAWRKQPASDSQRELVATRIGYRSVDEEVAGVASSALPMSAEEQQRRERTERTMDGLTKGKAGDILTKLKHGFRGRWQESAKAQNRIAAARAKERRRQQRETVKVGDLAT